MRTLAIAVVWLMAICGVAAAADISPPPPVYKAPIEPQPYMGWSGFYVGVNVGGGIGLGQSDFSIAGVPAFATAHNTLSGAIGGGQIGFNWQTGMTVVGVETDFQGSGLKGSLTAPCLPGLCGIPLSATYSQKVSWFGTARGRLGVASNGWLIYATGGYAYARLDTDAMAVAGASSASLGLHETRNGWTAGGGIEVAFAPGWSAKLEYLYLDFGRESTTWTLGALPSITYDARFTMNVVRAGVNYRF
jgi:outer membrane immunogenic protein